ncbi:MAG: ion transporter [Chitinophagales bacterium]|mgnify:CR=1 FL=1|nr:ion transporter [Chitinophagales bacterium]
MNPFKIRINSVIFGTDTPAGKLFDVVLLWMIVLSILVVMLESVQGIRTRFVTELHVIEWIFTGFFTLEYIARIYSHPKPKQYIFSFLGIIDLLAIVPTYISLLISGGQFLLVIRVLRLLRIFRIFKLSHFLAEGDVLVRAMLTSLRKIVLFFSVVLTLVLILGTLMYMIEGEENGFTSIPESIYWGIVTITTVGYGDIAPSTALGKMLASIIMILGYSIIAVPTGIVTVEMAKAGKTISRSKCQRCNDTGHEVGANYCKTCGEKLQVET